MSEKCKECMVGYWLPAPSLVGLTYESGCHSPAPTAHLRRFKYCPDCGRELGEKVEASVEERAETLEERYKEVWAWCNTLSNLGAERLKHTQANSDRIEALETGRAGQKSGCPSRIQLWVRIQVLEERSENWRRRIEALEKQVAALERRNTAPQGD